MKKAITTLAAMLLALSMMAMPAMADEPTLADLEAALAAAEAEVIILEAEVAALKAEIKATEDEIEVQEGVVDDLKGELKMAQDNLVAATSARDELQAAYDKCNPATSGPVNGNQCRGQLNGPIADADAQIVTQTGLVADAQKAVDDAEKELGKLQGELSTLNTELALTEAELAAAKQAVIDAQKAIDDLEAAKVHPGCTGINNAKVNVAKNVPVKSNANAALAEVSKKLGC
jgi:peptidoglycan hydrolase CwlO-like protein